MKKADRFFLCLMTALFVWAVSTFAAAIPQKVVIQVPIIANKKVAVGIRSWLKKEYAEQCKVDSGKDFSFQPKITVYDGTSTTQSIVISLESYESGHPHWIFSTYTYDVKKVKPIALPDLFVADSQWKEVLWPCVLNTAGQTLDGNKITSKHPQINQNYGSFSLDKRMLRLYFDQGLIAARDQGPIEVEIPLTEINPILKPRFQDLDPTLKESHP